MRWYRVDGPSPFMQEQEERPQEVVQTKIFCASIAGVQKHACWAVWRGGRLGITKLVRLPVGKGWQDDLRRTCTQKKAEGYAVYLEDRTGLFSPDATAVSFEDLQTDGRTLFQHACEMLTSLLAHGDVKYPPEYEPFILRAGEGGIIDLKTDDKGRVRYDADWSRITGAHKCVLMAVAAATMEEPWSDRWINAFRLAPALRPDAPSWDRTVKAVKLASTVGVQLGMERAQEELERMKEEVHAR